MREHYFVQPETIDRVRSSWIGEAIERYVAWLSDESYAAYRKVGQGEFTKIMNNIYNFKQLKGKCNLGVVIIVDRENAAHIYELIHHLFAVKVDSVKVSPCIVSNDLM